MKTCKRKNEYPSWARYMATDKNGDVYVYANYPYIGINCWLEFSGRSRIVKNKKPPKDWTKTLRRIRAEE